MLCCCKTTTKTNLLNCTIVITLDKYRDNAKIQIFINNILTDNTKNIFDRILMKYAVVTFIVNDTASNVFRKKKKKIPGRQVMHVYRSEAYNLIILYKYCSVCLT